MVPAARWLVVAAVALATVAAPTLVRAVPPAQSDVTARALVGQIRHAYGTGWSGEVSSQGSLSVPITASTFSGVARLLGQRSNLRVWWRSPTNWRIDRLRGTGESDIVRDGGLVVRWNYEANKVNFTPYSPIRLPDDADIVPVSLAHRMLSGSSSKELSRIPARRIVGRSAPGVRLVPADKRSTISRVDIWADQASGLPLRVDVYGASKVHPVLSTQLTSLTRKMPSAADANFELSPTIDFSRGVALDDAAGANAFAPFAPPDEVAALPRLGNAEDFGAVGVYGRGPTAILAVPLRDYVAGGLRTQLRKSPQSHDFGTSIALEIGPLSVLLADVAGGHFLVAGTVTPATLRLAARNLAAGVTRTSR